LLLLLLLLLLLFDLVVFDHLFCVEKARSTKEELFFFVFNFFFVFFFVKFVL